MKMRSLGFAVLFLALTFILQTRASAHAFLDHAEPAVGSRSSSPPTEVKIWFSTALEAKGSTIQVFDGQDNRVDNKDSHLDTKDQTLLTVSVPKLPPGSYKVVWRVVSSNDHHTTHGDFTFEVAPPK